MYIIQFPWERNKFLIHHFSSFFFFYNTQDDGSRVSGYAFTYLTSSLEPSTVSDDITSVIYPSDFIAISEDIPSLGGCREGKGSIVYKCKGHDDWSVFIFKGMWVDDSLHGHFSLHHNGRVLLEGEYKYGKLWFKGQECKEIRITDSGAFPVKTKSKMVQKVVPSTVRTEIHVSSPSIPVSVSEEVVTEPVPLEQTVFIDDSDDEVYQDDVCVQPIVSSGRHQEDKVQKQMKDLVKSILFGNNNGTGFASYSNKTTHQTFWFIVTEGRESKVMLICTINKNLPSGNTYIYQTSPLQFVGTMKMNKGICVHFIPPSEMKDGEQCILDLTDDGDRWEGSVRNMIPNGSGQYYNEDNVLVYEGRVLGGLANGLGKAFDPQTGCCSYYGMWSRGMRHGWGVEYDRAGNFVRQGVWIKNTWASLQMNPRRVKAGLSLEDYSPLVNVIYLSVDSYRHQTLLEIKDYPFLQALFINGTCFANTNLQLTNLPNLRKLVVTTINQSRQFSYYYNCLLVALCPALKEVWLNVDYEHGWIIKEKIRHKPTHCYADIVPREYEPRFVMEELEKVMKWKPSRKFTMNVEEPEDGTVLYFHSDVACYWDGEWVSSRIADCVIMHRSI